MIWSLKVIIVIRQIKIFNVTSSVYGKSFIFSTKISIWFDNIFVHYQPHYIILHAGLRLGAGNLPKNTLPHTSESNAIKMKKWNSTNSALTLLCVIFRFRYNSKTTLSTSFNILGRSMSLFQKCFACFHW